MPQQNLDGPQVRAVFEQVSGEAMSKRVGMNLFADARKLCRFSAGSPDNLSPSSSQ